MQRIHYNVYRRGDFIQFLNGLHVLAYFPVLLSGGSSDFTFLRCKSLNHCMKIEFRAKFVCVLKLSSFLPDAPLGTSKLDSNEDALSELLSALIHSPFILWLTEMALNIFTEFLFVVTVGCTLFWVRFLHFCDSLATTTFTTCHSLRFIYLARAVRKLLCGISGGCFLVTAPDPWNKGTLRIDMTSGQEFFCQFTVSSSVWSDRTVLRKPPDAPFKFSR
ncbi:hypothetical protein T12_4593 [Trichinella patagoniensis]|uniref:Uncharacterized protein n=1 Tax=Trichinella patagoniensis TaxID=990121 RepID=A0A0V0ZYK5_9BILA|nr:hypothetical protein T12_4593 [Trichinella patagoniensis]